MVPRDPGNSTGANDEMDVSAGTTDVMNPDAVDSNMSWGMMMMVGTSNCKWVVGPWRCCRSRDRMLQVQMERSERRLRGGEK